MLPISGEKLVTADLSGQLRNLFHIYVTLYRNCLEVIFGKCNSVSFLGEILKHEKIAIFVLSFIILYVEFKIW